MAVTIRRPWDTADVLKIDNLMGQMVLGEHNAHIFVIHGVDADGEAVPITGTISGSFLRADGSTVWIDTCTLVAGEAVVTLPAHCYDIPGRFVLSVYATGANDNICIYCAVGNVFRSQSDTVVDPGTIMPSVADLIAEIEAVNASIPADYSALATQVSANTAAIGTANGRISANESDIEEVSQRATANTTRIGNMNNLVTPTKTDLVTAINEAYNYDPTGAYDTAISSTSENAVQNKVIKTALDAKMNTPVSGGTAGQCLMSDGAGSFVWGTPTEVSVTLGDLALKDRTTATYTPQGTVSAPTITATSTGVWVDRMNDAGSVTAGTAASCTLPTLTMSHANETLTFAWTAGSFIANTPTSVTLPDFDRVRTVPSITATATAPTFTGTQATITST